MATYQYKAATTTGEIVDGVLTGSTREHVIAKLQSLGHVPIRVDESAAKRKSAFKIRLRRERITDEQIGDVTRALSTLLQAGLPLDRALAILTSLADSDALGSSRTRWRRRKPPSAASTSACCAPASPAARSRWSWNGSPTTWRARRRCAARSPPR
jgi:type II secretory pathway component PulF